MCNAKVRIAIAGAGGRMGKKLIQAALQTDGVILSSVFEYKGSSLIGIDAGELIGRKKIGITVQSVVNAMHQDFDVFIDFTHPKGTMDHLAFCRRYGKSMVIGTTGFSKKEKIKIREISNEISIVFSANFSVGVNIILQLLNRVAKIIGDYTDIEIIEMHHRYKLDIPSGTALKMGEVIASALNKDLKECSISHEDRCAGKRIPGTINFSSVRAGGILGEHKVMFVDIGEQIELTHKASSRMIYANGAIKSAIWIKGKKHGLFDMKDILQCDNI